MVNEYGFEVCGLDLHVALDCEADRAKREGFKLVEKRQRETALHIRNAGHAMMELCPPGHRLRTRIVIDFVPDVNAAARDDVRERRSS